VSFRKNITKYRRKVEIYKSYVDGSFDLKDCSRLKPITRLRDTMEEIEQEKSGDQRLRVKDWYKDIDRGFSK